MLFTLSRLMGVKPMVDLSGAWLGTFWQDGEPTRFEGSLVQGGGVLSGSILDDNELGESQVAGEVVGRAVRFNKSYRSGAFEAVQCTGTVNEDGDFIQGRWSIPGTKLVGQWEARRNDDDLMQQLRHRMEQKTPVGV
jgi:hypothetical protein